MQHQRGYRTLQSADIHWLQPIMDLWVAEGVPSVLMTSAMIVRGYNYDKRLIASAAAVSLGAEETSVSPFAAPTRPIFTVWWAGSHRTSHGGPNPISRVTPDNHLNGLLVLNPIPPVTEHLRHPLRLWHPLDGEVTPRDFAVSPWLRSKRPKLGIHLKCPFD